METLLSLGGAIAGMVAIAAAIVGLRWTIRHQAGPAWIASDAVAGTAAVTFATALALSIASSTVTLIDLDVFALAAFFIAVIGHVATLVALVIAVEVETEPGPVLVVPT